MQKKKRSWRIQCCDDVADVDFLICGGTDAVSQLVVRCEVLPREPTINHSFRPNSESTVSSYCK